MAPLPLRWPLRPTTDDPSWMPGRRACALYPCVPFLPVLGLVVQTLPKALLWTQAGGLCSGALCQPPCPWSLGALPPQPWAQDVLTSGWGGYMQGSRSRARLRAGGTAGTRSNFGGSQTSLSTGKAGESLHLPQINPCLPDPETGLC